MLGPGTLSKRLIAFAFLLRAVARGFGILEVRAPRRAADKLRFAQLRLHEHVIRNFPARVFFGWVRVSRRWPPL